MENIIKNDIYVIKLTNRNFYLGSKIRKIYKREDTVLQFFEWNEINDKKNDNMFYFYFDKFDKYFLMISVESKRCLGVYDDDKDMKLSLVQLSANANCKWSINIKGKSIEFMLKSKKLYLTLFNNSFCNFLQEITQYLKNFSLLNINIIIYIILLY